MRILVAQARLGQHAINRQQLTDDSAVRVSSLAVLIVGYLAREERDVVVEGAVLADRVEFVKERGLGAIGPLMGMVMGELGGSADGKVVSQTLKQKINEILEG